MLLKNCFFNKTNYFNVQYMCSDALYFRTPVD